MNTSHNIRPFIPVAIEQAAFQTSSKVREVIILGHQRSWDFTVLGQAPMPQESVRFDDWLIVPAHLDNSPIPTRALEMVQAIFAAGLRPKGFVVVHEAPRLLAAPSNPAQQVHSSVSLPDLTAVLKVAGGALGLIGIGVAASALAAISIAAILMVGVLAIPATLAVGVISLDPMLILITDDDYWIEIDRWWNSELRRTS